MKMPNWDDKTVKAGTKVRGALWLVQVIGVGNVFTKEQVRAAFPKISQADRRVRDLRDHGWIIHTRAEEGTLNADEQRFVEIGDHVWEKGKARDPKGTGLSAKKRREIFAAADYLCSVCGIAGGEQYPETPHITATLTISKRSVLSGDGGEKKMFVAVCKLCSSGANKGPAEPAKVVKMIQDLSSSERTIVDKWLTKGNRGNLERIWSAFRRMPEEAKAEIIKSLALL